MAPKKAKETILKTFARDLSTRTEAEIRKKWEGRHIDSLEKIHPGAFEGRLKDHNPIYYMAQKVWFDNDPKLLYAPLHRDRICKEILAYLTEENTHKGLSGLLVLVQRDSFKSTFMHGVVPLWFAIREKYVHGKDSRILLTHQREEQASLNLKKIKAKCINSSFMHEVWGEKPYQFAVEEDFGTATKLDWPCKEPGLIHEPSLMAAGSGARLVGMHFDLIDNDDLVDDEQRFSKTLREKAKNKYSASRMMMDTLRAFEINSGTPYHIHDLYNGLKIAKDEKGKLLYSTMDIGAGGKHTDEPLSMPIRHSQEFLDRRYREIVQQDGNDVFYWLQYQCEPRSSGMIATELDWIKEIALDEIMRDERNIQTCILVDPAWKGTKNSGTGHDAAIAVLGFERRGFITLTYLIDLIVSNEMSALDGTNCIFELMKQYGTCEVGVEEHNTHTFRTGLEHEAQMRGKWVHLLDFKSKFSGKSDRIVSFLQTVQAGRFYIVKGCRNKDVFLSQYEDFPQINKDDALDVVAYSADPNIAELFAPQWNTEAQGLDWLPQADSRPQRSRHCTI